MSNSISIKSKIYKDVYCRDSVIKDLASLGDNSSICDSVIGRNCEVGRRNLVVKSEIGECTYTGDNTIIQNSIIGKYCSISWNVSMGGTTSA